MTVSNPIFLLSKSFCSALSFLLFKKGLTGSIVQVFFAWRIRMLTKKWYYAAFVIAAAGSAGGDGLVLSFFYCLKTTVFSIVIAYLGRFSPQFTEFRAFKVLFYLILRHWCLFFPSFIPSQVVAILSFVSEMLGDLMITSIMVWFL